MYEKYHKIKKRFTVKVKCFVKEYYIVLFVCHFCNFENMIYRTVCKNCWCIALQQILNNSWDKSLITNMQKWNGPSVVSRKLKRDTNTPMQYLLA